MNRFVMIQLLVLSIHEIEYHIVLRNTVVKRITERRIQNIFVVVEKGESERFVRTSVLLVGPDRERLFRFAIHGRESRKTLAGSHENDQKTNQK